MRTAAGDVHLTRASGLLESVSTALAEFDAKVKAHDAALDETSGGDAGQFLSGLASGLVNKSRLGKDKKALQHDLDLAEQEIAHAERAEPQNEHIPHLRAGVHAQRGQLELISGSLAAARRHFEASNTARESAHTRFMLGLIDEAEYKPADALVHFERCLELEPAGEYSVAALREADSMRNYRKRFRGSWTTFCVLLLFWPAAVLYFFLKRK